MASEAYPSHKNDIVVHTIDTKDDEEPEGTRRARGSNHGTLDLYEDSRVQRFNQPSYHDPTKVFHRPSYLTISIGNSVCINFRL